MGWQVQKAEVTVAPGASPRASTQVGRSRTLAGTVTVKGGAGSPTVESMSMDGKELERVSTSVFKLPDSHLAADRTGAVAGIAAATLLTLALAGAWAVASPWKRRRGD